MFQIDEDELAAEDRSVSLWFVLRDGESFVQDGFTVREALVIIYDLTDTFPEGEGENETWDTLGAGDFGMDLTDVIFVRIESVT